MLFNSVVDQLKQAQLVSDYGSITAQILNPPVATEKRPSIVSALCAALVLGLGLGGGMAFVADLIDARVRSLSEIRKVFDLRVLGIIPQLTHEQLDPEVVPGLISHALPRSLLAESYKTVRTSLDLIRRNLNARVLLVSSPESGDGKSTIASNLAISLAHAGRKVLLIDADLRRPTQHLIHGLHRSPGLTHVLKDVLPYHRAVQRTPIDNLDLLTAGPEVSNPAELLASPRLASFVEEMRPLYEVVIFDSSPLLAVTDASIIASVVDSITLVVRVSATRRHSLERTLELLATLETPVLGMVVNGLVCAQHGYGYAYRKWLRVCGLRTPGAPEEEHATAPTTRAMLTASTTEHPAFRANETADPPTGA
jgi:capsular exopolysaccharide synthesis family protein